MDEILASGIHWRILNFAMFVGLLVYVLRKPVKEFLATRAQKIRSDIEEGEQLRRETEEKYRVLERRCNHLEQEMQSLVHDMDVEGREEQKRLVADAEALAQRIRSDSERIAAQEIRKAREALKTQAVSLAVELAEKMVKQGLRDEDQKRLAERYLEAFEGSPQ